MYGINELDNKNKLKGESTLYRGLKMSYINLSFYERNIDKVITLPSFTSCITDKPIEKSFLEKTKSGLRVVLYSNRRKKKK